MSSKTPARDPARSLVSSAQIEVPPSPHASTSQFTSDLQEEDGSGVLETNISVQDLIQPSSPNTSRNQGQENGLTSAKQKGKKKARRGISGPFQGKWNPSLTLENTGSVARDHLASERTFLAYVRTSLTIASSGVGEFFLKPRSPFLTLTLSIAFKYCLAYCVVLALVQLFNVAANSGKHVEKYSNPLGAAVILIGFLTLCLGVTRYFSVQSALVNGNFTVARVSPASIALALMAAIVASFGILLGARNGQR